MVTERRGEIPQMCVSERQGAGGERHWSPSQLPQMLTVQLLDVCRPLLQRETSHPDSPGGREGLWKLQESVHMRGFAKSDPTASGVTPFSDLSLPVMQKDALAGGWGGLGDGRVVRPVLRAEPGLAL